MRRLGSLPLVAFLVLAATLGPPAPSAGQTTPPPPSASFNDYAGLVTASERDRLNAKLRRFADETSTQIVVAVMPELPEDDALEDFTVRTAQAWRAGQKGLDNGAILFVFVKDRKIRIEVGYGLEGALPDAIAKRIIEEQIVPAFRAGNPAAGLEAGVEAMMAATRGEYTAKPRAPGGKKLLPVLIFFIILIVFLSVASRGGGGRMRGPLGRTYDHNGWDPGIIIPTGRSGWGGSWGGGGGSWGGGGGGGGFSGGGGSFGGGGASGSW
jgi:uncharacterized protein